MLWIVLGLLLVVVGLFGAWRLIVMFLNRSCVFCGIVKGHRPAKIVLRNQDMVVFHDIRPAGEIHLLCVPTHHINDVYRVADAAIFEKLEEGARQALAILGVKFGSKNIDMHFVRPPFNTVFHLHLSGRFFLGCGVSFSL